MKLMTAIYHFLGGIKAALILIALTALFVVAGTLVESSTESHLHASSFTYSNPAFKFLLWLFFINILFAALRRWPFKQRHIPFLLTHLGLLMLLGGTLIKSYFGMQGTLSILEGSSSQTIFLPQTYALHIEKKGSEGIQQIHFKHNFFGKLHSDLTLARFQSPLQEALHFKLLEWTPHSEERLQFWIKDGHAVINGLPSLPIYASQGPLRPSAISPLPFQAPLGIMPNGSPQWKIYALKTDDLNQLLHTIYLDNAQLAVSLIENQNEPIIIPLQKAVQEPQDILGYKIRTDIKMNYSPILGFQEAFVHLALKENAKEASEIVIPLTGPSALLNEFHSSSGYKSPPLAVDILLPPILILAQDQHKDDYLFMMTACGELHGESFRADNTQSIYSFDRGYQGYGLKAILPFHAMTPSRKAIEAAFVKQQEYLLQRFLKENAPLPFPVCVLYKASEKIGKEFPQFWLSFLQSWSHSRQWLYPPNRPLVPHVEDVFQAVNLEDFPQEMMNGCLWASQFFQFLESQWNPSENLQSFLQNKQWPLLKELKEDALVQQINPNDLFKQTPALLSVLTGQLLSLGQHLSPPLAKPFGQMHAGEKAHLLSVLLRCQGLDPFIAPSIDTLEQKMELLALLENPPVQAQELLTTVTSKLTPLPTVQKWENQSPLITLQISKGSQTETVRLSYDHAGSGLKRAIFGGEYLIRFQPQSKEIPYQVRLRHARQINYPGTLQPYSYESDLVFTENRPGAQGVEKTISMNHVHETAEGYRFYMSNLYPPAEITAKRAQIAVNYDPGKYTFTYPGAIILTIGMFLLFWMKKKALFTVSVKEVGQARCFRRSHSRRGNSPCPIPEEQSAADEASQLAKTLTDTVNKAKKNPPSS